MGGSSSKSSQKITNNTVNQNYMNTLNETIMNSAVETIVNNANQCSSAVNVNNSCDMSGAKIGGDFTFGGDQTAKAKVDFSCIQVSETSADMATEMLASMVAEMKALNGTEAAANLNAASDSHNKSGFISTPSSSKSSSASKVTNNVTNETISNVENIFEQNLSNNFTSNTVSECIQKTSVSNSQDLSNINVEGEANIECIQTTSVDQVQKCEQLASSIQKTTQETFQELGLTVATESDTGTQTESTVTSKSESVSTGPIEEMGDAIAGIVGAFGLAFLGPMSGSIVLCIVVLVILGLLGFLMSQFTGGSQSSPIISQGAYDSSFVSNDMGNYNMSELS